MEKLTRSEQAQINTQVFFLGQIDLTVYVEDKDESGVYAKFYELLLERIFNDLRIRIVYQGGREQVIKAHQLYLLKPIGSALFVVDGDYHILHSADKHHPKGLFQLKKYCIENYLIQEIAIVEVLYRNNSILSREKISEQLDFKSWMMNVCNGTMELAILYAICDVKKPTGVKTSKRDISEYKPNNDGEIDNIAVTKIIESINKTLESKYYSIEINELRITIEAAIQEMNYNPTDVLSGKSLILPLIFNRCCNRVSNTCTEMDVFSQQLIERCDLSGLYSMKDAVYSIM